MAPPTVVIAGSGGPIARHVARSMARTHEVVALTRSVEGSEPPEARPVEWNPRAAPDGDRRALEALASVLSGARAIVNLAGASIEGRMGPAHRRRVRESRLDSTATLVAALELADPAPDVWIQGSASGYYGDRGDEVLAEGAGPGRDFFLSDVAQAWEDASAPASARCRWAATRFGLVLARDASAFQKLMMPIRLFVGGRLGSGEQWMPWIHGDDLGEAVRFLIEREDASGAFNLVAPEPVRQVELARHAAARLDRPALFPTAAPLLRIVLGHGADQLLLPSQRLVPERLQALGFRFTYPDVERALDDLLSS